MPHFDFAKWHVALWYVSQLLVELIYEIQYFLRKPCERLQM